MTEPESLDALVEHYLGEVRRGLKRLPPEQCSEIMADLAEHIAHARSELPEQNEISLRLLIARIGRPEEIAAMSMGLAARQRPRWRRPLWIALAASLAAGISFAVMVASGPSTTAIPAFSSGPLASNADRVVSDLASAKWWSIWSEFDPVMKAGLNVVQMAHGWARYEASLGAYRTHGRVEFIAEGDFSIEYVPVEMGRGTGVVEVVFSSRKEISGLWLLPASALPHTANT
jgi:hypothetical protein